LINDAVLCLKMEKNKPENRLQKISMEHFSVYIEESGREDVKAAGGMYIKGKFTFIKSKGMTENGLLMVVTHKSTL